MMDEWHPRVLVIEDEAPMRIALRDILANEGYRVLTAADGESGLRQEVEEEPDLILLDVMLPKLDGYALCGELRRVGMAAPVLMLTAKAEVQDRVAGLDSGADDYLVKPFSTDELLARVRAQLRRVKERRRVVRELRIGGVDLDLAKMTARRGSEDIHVTAREYAVLRLLAEAAGEPVTRERFLDLAWGVTAFPTTRTVDNHIATLRAKLEPDPESPRWILTVHGVGYRLGQPEILQERDNSTRAGGQNADGGKS
jgi:DNA-binding response OmpR family regulator